MESLMISSIYGLFPSSIGDMEAWLIVAACSTSESAPPKLSARWKFQIFNKLRNLRFEFK